VNDLTAHAFDATTRDDLIRELAAVRRQILTPPRRSGLQDEWLAFSTIAATLAVLRDLTFPLEVAKSERPDFLLSFTGQTVGAEVTKAVDEGHRHVLAQAEPGEVVGLSGFRPDDPRRRWHGPDIVEKSHLRSKGWQGATPERNWRDYVTAAFRRKISKAADYQKTDRRWLLIDDKTPVTTALHVKPAMDLTRDAPRQESEVTAFDPILVRSDPWVIDLSQGSLQAFPAFTAW
jgi:hypothetical protein